MDKIQSAIAKARAARSANGSRISALHQLSEEPLAVPSTLLLTPDAAIASLQDEGAITRHWAALPEITLLPGHLERQRLPGFSGGPEATQFDILRTRVVQQMAQNGWKRLAITSPGPGCGKTTLALNLAFALGRRADLRTILAEVDLRRPTIQKVLGQRQAHSFADVLSGRSGFAQNALRYGSNLAFATKEGPSRQAASALHGDGVARVLDQIDAEYDPSIWIFDMPPMLANDDAMAFAGRVDCALILAAAETTTIKELDKCERELATQTNVMGVILNKCRYMERHDSYDYY